MMKLVIFNALKWRSESLSTNQFFRVSHIHHAVLRGYIRHGMAWKIGMVKDEKKIKIRVMYKVTRYMANPPFSFCFAGGEDLR